MKFHLTIFAIAFNMANSAPYGLIRRLGAGFDSIVVYAVPTSPGVSDQSYSSSSIGQNYYSPSSSSSYYSPSSDPIYSSEPSSGQCCSTSSNDPSYSSPTSGSGYSFPSSDPGYYSFPSSGPSYSSPTSGSGYSFPSSDPFDIHDNTATFCPNKIHSPSERNHRQRERITYQPVVRETFRSRNSYSDSSYGNEKTPAYRTPSYSVRDSFESSHRQKNYGRDNSRASQDPMVCTPNYLIP
jgi:hypothetical protein